MKEKSEHLLALIRYRLEQADQAVSDSELLIGGQRYQAAANRLYYACFYAATAALLIQRLQYSKHSAVITFFDKSLIKTGILPKEYSRTLHFAFNERQEDDYKPFKESDPDTIKKLYSKVQQMVSGVRQYVEEKMNKEFNEGP